MTLDSLAGRLYSGPVKAVSKQTGLHARFQSLGWRVFMTRAGLPSLARHRYRSVPLPLHEAPVLEDVFSQLSASDVFYDLGANLGSFSIPASHCGADVVAFEPHPSNISALEQTAISNGVAERIDVHDVAVGEETGEAELEVHSNTKAHRLQVEDEFETITVDVVRGDDYIQQQNLPTPSVIKIDIEGAEARALRGLEETIRSADCRLIYCEIHTGHVREYGDSPETVRKLLAAAGYTIETIHSRGQGEFVKATW